MDSTGGIHVGTGRVDHHGDGGTDEAARTGQWVGLVEPDADWDVVLVSLVENRQRPGQVEQLPRLLVGETVKVRVEPQVTEPSPDCVEILQRLCGVPVPTLTGGGRSVSSKAELGAGSVRSENFVLTSIRVCCSNSAPTRGISHQNRTRAQNYFIPRNRC